MRRVERITFEQVMEIVNNASLTPDDIVQLKLPMYIRNAMFMLYEEKMPFKDVDTESMSPYTEKLI